MYPATLDHSGAYQSEARRRACLHRAAISTSVKEDEVRRSRKAVRRSVFARNPVPTGS